MADPPQILAADQLFAAFVGFVVLAVTTETAIGFGSVLVALTLGAHIYPISTLLPLAVCMNVTLTSYIVARYHDHVEWRVVLTRILPAMAVGMFASSLFLDVPDAVLKTFLGVFVVTLAAVELRRLTSSPTAPPRAMSNLRFATISVAAGVVHGLTASSGPLLVYAINRLGLDKANFRSTGACVFLTLNGILIVTYVSRGRLGAHNAPYVAALVPAIAMAIGLGEWLHDRIDERTFRIVVLVLLLLAGLSLVV